MSEASRSPRATSGGYIGLEEIKQIIPHRYPFLLIDRVLSWQLEPERKLTAIKNVTVNEPFFQGHFPGNPLMPGVFIIEALAQAAGVLGALSQPPEQRASNLYYLVKIDEARFKRTVMPGDQLQLKVRETRRKGGMGFFSCEALVDGEKVASSKIVCAGRD